MNYKLPKAITLTLILLNGCFAVSVLATDTTELEVAIQKGDEEKAKQLLEMMILSKDEQERLLNFTDYTLLMRKGQVEANQINPRFNDSCETSKEAVRSGLYYLATIGFFCASMAAFASIVKPDQSVSYPLLLVAIACGSATWISAKGCFRNWREWYKQCIEYSNRFVYLYEKTLRIKQLIYKVRITSA